MSPPHPIPLPGGERDGVRGERRELLTKCNRERLWSYGNEPQYLFNEFPRRGTGKAALWVRVWIAVSKGCISNAQSN
jgi:hypothetical protein